MTLIEKKPNLRAVEPPDSESEAEKNLAALLEEARNRPQPAVNDDAPVPTPPTQDKRTPAQRKADFMRDCGRLLIRDRIVLISVQRWFPDGRTTMEVEPATFELKPPTEDPN